MGANNLIGCGLQSVLTNVGHLSGITINVRSPKKCDTPERIKEKEKINACSIILGVGGLTYCITV